MLPPPPPMGPAPSSTQRTPPPPPLGVVAADTGSPQPRRGAKSGTAPSRRRHGHLFHRCSSSERPMVMLRGHLWLHRSAIAKHPQLASHSPNADPLNAFLVDPSGPRDDGSWTNRSRSSLRSSSSLPPYAAPFHPWGTSVGRSKARCWADDDLGNSDVEASSTVYPSTYLDAVLREPQVPRTPPLPEREWSHSIIVVGACGHAEAQQPSLTTPATHSWTSCLWQGSSSRT